MNEKRPEIQLGNALLLLLTFLLLSSLLLLLWFSSSLSETIHGVHGH